MFDFLKRKKNKLNNMLLFNKTLLVKPGSRYKVDEGNYSAAYCGEVIKISKDFNAPVFIEEKDGDEWKKLILPQEDEEKIYEGDCIIYSYQNTITIKGTQYHIVHKHSVLAKLSDEEIK